MSLTIIDITENILMSYGKEIFNNLLSDKTSKKNIVWATNDYVDLGSMYHETAVITVELVTGLYSNVIQPRVTKSKDSQLARRKDKAEVFTPAWVCNNQNNLIDDSWFGKTNVFNISTQSGWISTKEKIVFGLKRGTKWQDYVDAKRIEITCGEAPYLTSRYDMSTGEYIEVVDRIGLLDRKLRVVSENTNNIEDWIKWATRATQSIYGFEYQGDSLLIARENILLSFIENMEYSYHQKPDKKLLKKISNIISWNIWQMNGLNYMIPYAQSEREDNYCKIHDWRSKETVLFKTIAEKGVI